MALTYETGIKTARMQAVVDAIDSHATLPGTLEIGTAAMAAVLATFTLADPSGTVAADVLTIDADPDLATTASATGKAIEARIKDGAGLTRVSGLTVGLTSAAAPAWAGSTAYVIGDYVTNGANQYVCTVAGTSAASGGPTGTGAGITDGTVTWDYYAPAGAHVQFDSIQWTSGQALNLTAGTITHAA